MSTGFNPTPFHQWPSPYYGVMDRLEPLKGTNFEMRHFLPVRVGKKTFAIPAVELNFDWQANEAPKFRAVPQPPYAADNQIRMPLYHGDTFQRTLY